MKKYKLIKKFPKSPEIGLEVEWNDYSALYYSIPRGLLFKRSEVQDYPEFWEEVKEYEVLLVSNLGGIRKVKDFDLETGGYLEQTPNSNEFYSSKDSSKHIIDNYTIHSVKRLSDKEVFSVGNKVEHKKGAKFTIKEIRIYEGNLQLTSGTGIVASIGDIEHYKEFSFISDDDVKLYENDVYYTVFKEYDYGKELFEIYGPHRVNRNYNRETLSDK